MARCVTVLCVLWALVGCAQPPRVIDTRSGGSYLTLLRAWLDGSDAERRIAVTTAQQNPEIAGDGKASVDALLKRFASTAEESEISGPQAFATYARGSWLWNEVEFYKQVVPSFDERAALLNAYQSETTRRAEDLASKRAAEEKRSADARVAEEKRLADARVAEEKGLAEKRRLDDMIRKLVEARSRAAWLCKGATCEKVFSLAQIFVDQHSDMKIQIATNTIVETFNPTEVGQVGLKIVKQPLKGDQAEVRITVVCKTGNVAELCLVRELATYLAFPSSMKERLIP